MSKRDKILADWKNQPQPGATVDTVEAILSYYFGSDFFKATGAGSHQFRVSHPALFGQPHFVGGTLSVPVSGGQTVKAIYLKRIAEAIRIIQEAETNDPHSDDNEN
jgi:hypothetical protein